MTTKSPVTANKIKEWSTVLKKDSDYDYSYILTILQYKLERMRNCLLKGITSDRKKIAQEIKAVEVLLKKVIDDKYLIVEFKKLEKKYGPLRLRIKTDKKTGVTTFVSAWDKLPPIKSKQAKDEWMKSYKVAFKHKQKDLKKAFNLMVDNIWKWWE